MSNGLSMSERLRLVCEMHDLGVEMMRQNLIRRKPEASREEIERMLIKWLQDRPGAEHGDIAGPGLRVRMP